VGSLVVTDAARAAVARVLRKRLGGGIRLAGILAAAGLHALEHHRARLPEDHANAKALAEGLAGAKGVRVLAPQTNIVMIDLERGTCAQMIEKAKAQGVMIGAMKVDARAYPIDAAGIQRIRAVTHLDVDRAAVQRAAQVIAVAAASL
jgi:threonine aldolase